MGSLGFALEQAWEHEHGCMDKEEGVQMSHVLTLARSIVFLSYVS